LGIGFQWTAYWKAATRRRSASGSCQLKPRLL